MTFETPAHADRAFFTALQRSDRATLDALLTDDFLLVDVMRGGEIPRAALLDALAAGAITFDSITLVDSHTRAHGDTAIIVGRTRMSGHAGPTAWSAHSRYTHVFLRIAGSWRLASAQGTPVAE